MSVYSLYHKGAFTRSTLVFPNDHKNLTSAQEEGQALYEITRHTRSMELIRCANTQTLLTGKYEGFTARTMSLTGFGATTKAKQAGMWKLGWKFIDFSSNEFTWHVSAMSSSWTLTDQGGRVVAKFTRARLRISKLGVLEVMERVDEALLALILVTCKIVHHDVQESEQNSGGGG
ncbi:hypothetical protein H4S07_000447 [Coemansia furcata]|uniref:Uncharacterized protein n=1 Tax=Coemansia furcata TaxID=417177 RepID=A0ACC1LR38_9FUNG|nr:hypothetical protein H4S07_000447 [Coemansia furcata]